MRGCTFALPCVVGRSKVKEGPDGQQHHHGVLRLFGVQHRFLPFKEALRRRWAIATHWSTSHTQLWSAIRYVHCTPQRKRVVDKQTEVWTRCGRKLNLYEESQEPFQSEAWNAHRERQISRQRKHSFPFTATAAVHHDCDRRLDSARYLEWLCRDRLC